MYKVASDNARRAVGAEAMTEDDKRAMQAAWYEWHAGVSLHIMPAINTSFGRGFEAGMAHARAASDAVIAGLRGENEVLRDLLERTIPVIETVSGDDADDWMMATALCAKIKAALAPYGANGDLLI